jgi:hypothetical protein
MPTVMLTKIKEYATTLPEAMVVMTFFPIRSDISFHT